MAKKSKPETVQFTGVARSVECVKQQGFNNFRLVTLKIEDGLVVDKKTSYPYCQVEAIAFMEKETAGATWNLNCNYEDGKAWET